MKSGNTDNLKCRNGISYRMDGESAPNPIEEDIEVSEESSENEYSAPPTPTFEAKSVGDCYNFSELEAQLFESEEGEKTLARIITRMRIEGYDEEAWKVVIGLTAFAYKNFNCKGIPISQQLKMLESAPLREITQFIPGDINGLVNSVLASDTIGVKESKKDMAESKDLYKIIALSLTALAFSYATRR